MSIIGKTLGHYAVETLIGRGGMGEVYKAKDQKLGRDVAIKVLPEEFAKDADRVARFQREAKLLASLNHPNIAAIYGLEESGGTSFLVLELVEGETLADRLKHGAIPVEEALKLALQIAEALEAAHEKGVIHRDLKPANIKVTSDGKVKVLDFGLAKAFAGDQAEVNLSHSPTLSEAATLQGVILGTAAYMSPEQARGKPVDKRTDIWAFGCVLYEMLTGKAAFQGEDVTEILAAVVKSEVNLDLLPANIHPRVREVIIRCLQKEQKKRYGAIGEAQYETEQVLADPSRIFLQPITATKPREKLRLGLSWVAAAIVTAVIIAGIAVWNLKPTEPRQISSFNFQLPEGQQFFWGYPSLAISPDGRQIVYSTGDGLYLRSVNELVINPIRGSDKDAVAPFFSPDGQWIAYWSRKDQKLKKIAINGGTPVILCDAMSWGGASWGKDYQIIFSTQDGLMRVSGDGGIPELLVRSEGEYMWSPEILPGGKSVIFTLGLENKLVVQSLESDSRTELLTGTGARYLPTGHIVYGVDDSLYAVPFDLDTLTVTGGQVPIVEGVLASQYLAEPQYDVSDSGTLVYIPGRVMSSQAQLEWCDRQGNKLSSVGEPAPYVQFSLSPDETRVVIERGSANNYDLWVIELNRGGVGSPITFESASERDPIWSPDGDFIAFNSNRNGPDDLYKISLITEEEVELLSDPHKRLIAEDWSNDGRYIVYGTSATQDEWLWLLSLFDDQSPRPVVTGKFTYDEPKFSPDGKWLAYISNESGNYQVYLKPLEGEGEKQIISTQGGGQPQWRKDGKELYYLALDGWIMAVELKGESLKPSVPIRLFQTDIMVLPGMDQYAVTGDGQRFLILSSEKVEQKPSVNIVLNWFEELTQKVPVE
jgi:serine/threonine protein kinase